MFSDNTLTPKEAIRLCALGTLALKPHRYSELATSIRHFVSHIQGPNLDMMGSSIELLKFEGLVEALDGQGMEDNATLSITDQGQEELRTLLSANIRATATELNKLVVALKFRFLHFLDNAEQTRQIDMLIEATEKEHDRLSRLRNEHAGGVPDDEGGLTAWLNHDIGELDRRLSWLQDFRKKI